MKPWRIAVLAILLVLGLIVLFIANEARDCYKRGNAYRQKGDWDRAIADLNRGLEVNPKDADAYHTRGFVYARKGDLDRAIADYRRALQLDPQNWRAQYNKAELLDKSGKPKEALEAYQSFLKSAPPQTKNSIDRARERIKALGK